MNKCKHRIIVKKSKSVQAPGPFRFTLDEEQAEPNLMLGGLFTYTPITEFVDCGTSLHTNVDEKMDNDILKEELNVVSENTSSLTCNTINSEDFVQNIDSIKTESNIEANEIVHIDSFDKNLIHSSGNKNVENLDIVEVKIENVENDYIESKNENCKSTDNFVCVTSELIKSEMDQSENEDSNFQHFSERKGTDSLYCNGSETTLQNACTLQCLKQEIMNEDVTIKSEHDLLHNIDKSNDYNEMDFNSDDIDEFAIKPRHPFKQLRKTCFLCEMLVVNIDTHLNMMHKEGIYIVCPYCDFAKTSQYEKSWRPHVTVHRKEISNQCSLCNEKFSRWKNLVKHTSRYHLKKVDSSCMYCDYKCETYELLVAHILMEHENNHFLNKCQQCHFQTLNAVALEVHVKGKHTLHNCQNCNYTTYKIGELIQHTKKCLAGVSAKKVNNRVKMDKLCSYCGYRSKLRSTVNKHMIRRHKQHFSTLPLSD